MSVTATLIVVVLDKPSLVLILCLILTFQMTSQVPYMEQFMGPPHVFTLDIGDTQAVEDTLTAAMATIVRSQVKYLSRSPSDLCIEIGGRYFSNSIVYYIHTFIHCKPRRFYGTIAIGSTRNHLKPQVHDIDATLAHHVARCHKL